MNSFKSVLIKLIVSFFLFGASITSHALVIGHYDSNREISGFSSGYLSSATQWLTDNGHTLAPTSFVDDVYLSGVDAFFTGLVEGVSPSEVNSMRDFVDVSGGFLFIQQDHERNRWHEPANEILANWGISTTGYILNLFDDNTVVSTSSWVTTPNIVTGTTGILHSYIDSAPTGFEVLVEDSANRALLGVFDAGAGRSSDVLVSTDIDFWSDSFGWQDSRNRALWENIWASADLQLSGGSGGGSGSGGSGGSGSGGSNNGGTGGSGGSGSGGNGGIVGVAEPSPLMLLAIGLAALCVARNGRQKV